MDAFPATSVNTVMLVGHNTLRLMAMGMANRPPTADEMTLMRRMLEEALAAGALGLSSGLFTAPGCFAGAEEMVSLAHVLRRYGASYATHVRDEARRVFEAVREAIAIAQTCGVHVEIVHLKLSGTDPWGRPPAAGLSMGSMRCVLSCSPTGARPGSSSPRWRGRTSEGCSARRWSWSARMGMPSRRTG